MSSDDERHRAGVWAVIQDIIERAKTDSDCIAAAAELGLDTKVFDEMKKTAFSARLMYSSRSF